MKYRHLLETQIDINLRKTLKYYEIQTLTRNTN